jgi:hypothetical protein
MDPGQWRVLAEVGCYLRTVDPPRHACTVLRKVRGHQGPGKDDDILGTPKGWTFKKRRRARPKRNSAIRERGLRLELCLQSRETFYEAFGQIIGLVVVKRAVESSIRLRKMSVKTLWRSWAPPKRKNIRSKHSPRKRRIMVVHLDCMAPYLGTTRDQRP